MTSITCREIAAFLSDYVDGDLPADRRALFESHLVGCLECLVYVRGFEATVRLTGAVGAMDDEDPIPERLVTAILAARSPR